MESIYSKNPERKYDLIKSISTPLFNGNNISARIPLYLNNDEIKIQMMENHIKNLEKEKNQQEEQINALMSYRLNELNNNYNNGISLTAKNLDINDGGIKYYFLKKKNNNKLHLKKSKMKKYKENIKNLKELLEKERMKKRLNKSLCHNLYFNIRKDMSNYINEINKSFEKKMENDNGLNNSMNQIKKNYNEIKNLLNEKITKMQIKQKKGFNDIKNEMLYKLKNMKEKERIKNLEIKKEIKDKLKNQRKLENKKRQEEIDKFRRKYEIEDIENQKLIDELKFEKIKKDIIKQRNNSVIIPRLIPGYQQYPINPYMFPSNYYSFL